MPDNLRNDAATLKAVAKVVKARFSNMTVDETIDFSLAILQAILTAKASADLTTPA